MERDEGTIFAERNSEQCLREAENNLKYNYLARAIKRELRKCRAITKTGDLIRYYESFKDGDHRRTIDFALLAKECNHTFLPLERMADALRARFPSEVNHVTTPKDLTVGNNYSNDFLSVVLGGSYMASFRNSRYPGISYIVMNPNVTAPNDWDKDHNVLWYKPTTHYWGEEDGAERFAKSHKKEQILIFERLTETGFVYVGTFRIKKHDDKTNKVMLERDEDIPNDKRQRLFSLLNQERTHLGKAKEDQYALKFADIILQKAQDNGVEYNLTWVIKQNPTVLQIKFPNGFFELFGVFDPRTVLIADHYEDFPREVLIEGNSERLLLSSESILEKGDQQDSFSWDGLALEYDDYQEKYFQQLLKRKDMTGDYSNIGTIEKTLEESAVGFEHFLVEAISQDFASERSHDSVHSSIHSEVKNQEANVFYDLVLQGFYGRIGINDPAFEIKTKLDQAAVNEFLSRLPNNMRKRVTFIDLSRDRTGYLDAFGDRYLILGLCFVRQMIRLYSSAYLRFVVPTETINTVKAPISDSDSFADAEEYSIAIDRNIKSFATAFATKVPTAIIIGNGVSIPFGSEGWKELSWNLFEQMKGHFIETPKKADEFLGESELARADIAQSILTQDGWEEQYWKSLKHSIYRRFNSALFDEDSALKVLAEIKHAYSRRISLITYNYDTFLEGQYHALFKHARLSAKTKASSKQLLGKTVLHVHGLFKPNEDHGSDIVLTRSDYFRTYADWKSHPALSTLSEILSTHLCLFVGSSMTDIYQLQMIEEAAKSLKSPGRPNTIYAMLCIKQLKDDEKALKYIYRYYLRKNIVVIPIKSFADLPSELRSAFGIKDPSIKR